MLAVHFGAGNIGRGFIGSLLNKSGYKVCFVDVNKEVVDLLNERKKYRVVLADENSEEMEVDQVFAINSMTHKEDVIDHIAKADLVTTAVGPTILPLIAEVIASGLMKRIQGLKQPLNIIACENMIGASSFLKEQVYQKIDASDVELFDEYFGFPDAAVDRIVPNQTNEDKLKVAVEPFYEWVVDQTKTVGGNPAVEGIHYVDNLSAYIERKLFTVNTGHAVAAYLGYKHGLNTIMEAMENNEIYTNVENALKESGAVLVEKYGFDENEHSAYIAQILSRFQNIHISDEITRVARGPLRKLGPNDRLISPARQYVELLGGQPIHLAKAIAAALQYDYQGDEEAVKLQEMIRKQGIEATLIEVGGLEPGHPLIALVSLGDGSSGSL
ncbi:mannitol-1-phosphate 5-dehydrogenase [Cytobacillus sp. NCCP-133]|uniref:mannitol-1-phosphate 5-dehydrogenase n=1 Tax=Cytobacillus sp. NCCP-133 TaxID=766848 RepID=UPI002232BF04|nr:mannitol-1-phosphate 5-dehydrogenase [Cytobacillus sp. NCCP-133]GLB59172.1 mannitol-1-phosphate 5-dehydrogenase [Cytobacillus sp. NCCP-133]